MTDNNAYTQAEVDSVVAIVGRQAERGRSIVHALEHVVKDRSITAAGRELVRIALEDARAIVAGAEVAPPHTSMEGALRSVQRGAAERLRRSMGMPDVP